MKLNIPEFNGHLPSFYSYYRYTSHLVELYRMSQIIKVLNSLYPWQNIYRDLGYKLLDKSFSTIAYLCMYDVPDNIVNMYLTLTVNDKFIAEYIPRFNKLIPIPNVGRGSIMNYYTKLYNE